MPLVCMCVVNPTCNVLSPRLKLYSSINRWQAKFKIVAEWFLFFGRWVGSRVATFPGPRSRCNWTDVLLVNAVDYSIKVFLCNVFKLTWPVVFHISCLLFCLVNATLCLVLNSGIQLIILIIIIVIFFLFQRLSVAIIMIILIINIIVFVLKIHVAISSKEIITSLRPSTQYLLHANCSRDCRHIDI